MKCHQEHPNLDRGLLKESFLVLLFILGHTVTPTYSKRLFTLIENNDILKHIILIWVIYFSIDFADKSLKHHGNLQTKYIYLDYISYWYLNNDYILYC